MSKKIVRIKRKFLGKKAYKSYIGHKSSLIRVNNRQKGKHYKTKEDYGLAHYHSLCKKQIKDKGRCLTDHEKSVNWLTRYMPDNF